MAHTALLISLFMKLPLLDDRCAASWSDNNTFLVTERMTHEKPILAGLINHDDTGASPELANNGRGRLAPPELHLEYSDANEQRERQECMERISVFALLAQTLPSYSRVKTS
jgi:hypothetical protein